MLGNLYAMKHGKRYTRVYSAWASMKKRCLDTDNLYYGGRGIKVCERWMRFENFYEDMGDPIDGQSLDRIDYNGNYEPHNCRWANSVQQNNNSRNNRLMVIEGETMTMKHACEKYNVNYIRVRKRKEKGWSDRDSIFTPKYSRRVKP